jgi:hypothetical protein
MRSPTAARFPGNRVYPVRRHTASADEPPCSGFSFWIDGACGGFELPADRMGQFSSSPQMIGRRAQPQSLGLSGPIDIIGGMIVIVPNPVLKEFAYFLGLAEFSFVLPVVVGVLVVMVIVHGFLSL